MNISEAFFTFLFMCTAQNVSFVLFAIKWIKIANKSVIHYVRTAQFFVLVKMFTFSLLFVIKCLINCFTIIFDLVHPSPLAAHEEQQEKHSWNFNFLLLFFVFFVRGSSIRYIRFELYKSIHKVFEQFFPLFSCVCLHHQHHQPRCNNRWQYPIVISCIFTFCVYVPLIIVLASWSIGK